MELPFVNITSIYKPPNKAFTAQDIPINVTKPQIVIGDFNSHHQSWGYRETDLSGEAVEQRPNLVNNRIHDSKLPASFNSARWHRGYNPDLCFVSDSLISRSSKTVHKPIPRSQDRPIGVTIKPLVQPLNAPMRRRFNFKKSDWECYATELDKKLDYSSLEPTCSNYQKFVEIIKIISRKTIPRHCRKHFIPGLTEENMGLYEDFQNRETPHRQHF